MSRFEETMRELEYAFIEQDGKKLTYRKRTRMSDLTLVIDLELKTIRPVSIPTSMFISKDEVEIFSKEFEQMQVDANLISQRSNGKLKVLD